MSEFVGFVILTYKLKITFSCNFFMFVTYNHDEFIVPLEPEPHIFDVIYLLIVNFLRLREIINAI